MKLWTARAGKYGEQEQVCIKDALITIGWNDLPDLRMFKSREELAEEFQRVYQESSGKKVGEIWRFSNEILEGHVVALPSKFQPVIHIGRVTGAYHYEKKGDEVIHWIPVKWLRSIPRVEFDQDLLYSLGSLLTVSQVQRDKAAEHVLALTEGRTSGCEDT